MKNEMQTEDDFQSLAEECEKALKRCEELLLFSGHADTANVRQQIGRIERNARESTLRFERSGYPGSKEKAELARLHADLLLIGRHAVSARFRKTLKEWPGGRKP